MVKKTNFAKKIALRAMTIFPLMVASSPLTRMPRQLVVRDKQRELEQALTAANNQPQITTVYEPPKENTCGDYAVEAVEFLNEGSFYKTSSYVEDLAANLIDCGYEGLAKDVLFTPRFSDNLETMDYFFEAQNLTGDEKKLLSKTLYMIHDDSVFISTKELYTLVKGIGKNMDNKNGSLQAYNNLSIGPGASNPQPVPLIYSLDESSGSGGNGGDSNGGEPGPGEGPGL